MRKYYLVKRSGGVAFFWCLAAARVIWFISCGDNLVIMTLVAEVIGVVCCETNCWHNKWEEYQADNNLQ